MPSDDVLVERIEALCQLFEIKLTYIQDQLNDLTDYVVGKEKFNHLLERVDDLETFKHESREWRRSVDRAVWLLSIIGGVCLTVITALIVAWATGRLQVVWK